MGSTKSLAAACRRAGVTDARVLRAVAQTPRKPFLPAAQHRSAGSDRALPIGDGQTSSQPSLVAKMIEALALSPEDRVLEIGTGSGYQTALLAQLCAEVVSVEHNAMLADRARRPLAAWPNIVVHVGDGTLGWPDSAPYHGIVVSATGPWLPPALADQLAEGGRIVMPVEAGSGERVEVHRRHGDVVRRESVLAQVRFVPLIGEQGYDA